MVFSVFIIHLANLRSVKIVQKSVKSQGIFQLLMSGNPAVLFHLLYVIRRQLGRVVRVPNLKELRHRSCILKKIG